MKILNPFRTRLPNFSKGQMIELSQLDTLLDVPVRNFDRVVADLVSAFRKKEVRLRIPTAAEMDGFSRDDARTSWSGIYEARIGHGRKMDRPEEFLFARRYEFVRARAKSSLDELGVTEAEQVAYLQQVEREFPASRKETAKEYARQALRELGELRNRYVEGGLYIVLGLAHRYRGLGVDENDLIQEGNASLFQAIEGFDWRRDVRFRTYAQYWVQQAILKMLYNASRTVRVPIWVQKALRKIDRARESVRTADGLDPSSAAIGAKVGMTAERVEELVATRRYAVSLDAELPGQDGASMVQMLADHSAQPIPESIHESDLGTTLRQMLVDLPPREKLILNRRFGLEGVEPQTLGEIAAELGITAERVRQLQNAALGRLKKPGMIRRLEQFAS